MEEKKGFEILHAYMSTKWVGGWLVGGVGHMCGHLLWPFFGVGCSVGNALLVFRV